MTIFSAVPQILGLTGMILVSRSSDRWLERRYLSLRASRCWG
jgi:hypothetical protein